MELYKPSHPVRILTASSLFDGHDAAINIMRRLMQAGGAEIIHLGHNRSVQEIVDAAIQEDVQSIAITSYQGGHMEFFKYMYDLLKERKSNIKIFGGGGGTILPEEIKELEAYGIQKIYSPEDGRKMGLDGMISDVLKQSDFALSPGVDSLSRRISIAEADENKVKISDKGPLVLGVTGTGGAGKSSLVDELVRRILLYSNHKIAVLSVDPTRKKSGGALLGDRIRMNSVSDERVFMRSLATRGAVGSLSESAASVINVLKKEEFDLIILETSGTGQSDIGVTELSDVSLYIMTSEYGASTQLEKIDMLDYADVICINKFDKKGSLDALRDVKKQFKRNHNAFEAPNEELPIFGTRANVFNDSGVNALTNKLAEVFKKKHQFDLLNNPIPESVQQSFQIIPPERSRYLAEIAVENHKYEESIKEQASLASKLYKLKGVIEISDDEAIKSSLEKEYKKFEKQLTDSSRDVIEKWAVLRDKFREETYTYRVRGKEFRRNLFFKSLSGTKIPKIAVPTYSDWGDLVRWWMNENFPGRFPYTAGVFPLKREEEDPTRMFAGEGGPERTNRRFHYLCRNESSQRLSTACDSVTLYGEDPDERPDIYGKIGNSGVSIATLDDAKKLYSGFDLSSPSTSVSMTINGPAPIVLAFFLNAAIDQQCELYLESENRLEEIQKLAAQKFDEAPTYSGDLPKGNDGLGLKLLGISGADLLKEEEYNKIASETIEKVRGTVQADILKEDQAQNTCIFTTEFALKLMGDIQEYFIQNNVRNFYSVSISGYHIAEAGANPITQLAFTLANGFTFVEYYLSRGMEIDEFAPNLSFFFSNGLDAEYAVIGRVARRIWSKAIREIYGGNERSQKLKYHIQTSGRSLHAQEIDFNDIRTTLQALYAIYDNCNSLHTNAFDEAVTTPTEASVRRAVAIQLIINKELGLNKNQNPMQGSFVIDELTNLVEEAVMHEFHSISERGGVLGAMETMYQRSKIQEESMDYEHRKHSGDIPIVGVNMFLLKDNQGPEIPSEIIRATGEEKHAQINAVKAYQNAHSEKAASALEALKHAVLSGENTFPHIMVAARYCSLGQITNALYNVGGKYRRSM